MRLNRFNPGSIRVGRGGSGGGRPMRAGGIGCGGLIIVLIGSLVFGVDPGQMLGLVEGVQQTQAPQQQAPSRQQPGNADTTEQICSENQYSLEACNALASLNQTWQPIFQHANIPFRQPTLWFYRGGTQTGCGAASSAMGPFYCPPDQGIYIDTSFYDELANQLGAKGDFARYYVIAHEYGHHVQQLTGLADQITRAQQANPAAANRLQVAMELQADCYAGVWAGKNRNLIEPGDFEEGMRAASAIGDDTLSRRAGRRPNPESFTHGTSEQRMYWLRKGMQSADEDQCDTFAELQH